MIFLVIGITSNKHRGRGGKLKFLGASFVGSTVPLPEAESSYKPHLSLADNDCHNEFHPWCLVLTQCFRVVDFSVIPHCGL
jgi:hypothetical protein